MIALVDYGAGNLTSVRKALAAVGAAVTPATAPAHLADAAGIVLPGVGHYRATAALHDVWRAAFSGAIEAGVPVLGICLGMQWLFDGSDEAPEVPGFGYFPGRVGPLRTVGADGSRLKVPQVGWNVVDAACAVGLHAPALRALHGQYVYFTHSYAAPVTPDCAGVTTYGQPFAAAAARGRVWGVQFHPEKSGRAGLDLLRAFVEAT